MKPQKPWTKTNPFSPETNDKKVRWTLSFSARKTEMRRRDNRNNGYFQCLTTDYFKLPWCCSKRVKAKETSSSSQLKLLKLSCSGNEATSCYVSCHDFLEIQIASWIPTWWHRTLVWGTPLWLPVWCYSLDLECPPKAHVLKTWSPWCYYQEAMEPLAGRAYGRSLDHWECAPKGTVGSGPLLFSFPLISLSASWKFCFAISTCHDMCSHLDPN